MADDIGLDGARPTPLFDLHESLKARMAPFAGWALPIQYPSGILREHAAAREAAALFDVSHMGQAFLRPKSGKLEDAMLALERLAPVSVAGLAEGRQRYGLFTSPDGGILDDFMFANLGDALFVVVNAARRDHDFAHLEAHLSDVCELETLDDRALIALQGPKAEAAMTALGAAVGPMRFMDVAETALAGVPCLVSRSGYTGEDGFEISLPADRAVGVAEALLEQPGVAPAGLGARDSLRLEAGLCLYGSDIDETTSPIEAGLAWAIQKIRRAGGARAGGFPGAERILSELASGPARLRVGLLPEGRAPMRAPTPIFAAEDAAEPVGTVVSGAFGPTLGGPMAMAYVPAALSAPGTRLFGEVRGKRLPAQVAELPFVPHRYKR
ncbi:glycine cleavage system aminomethyltransferase GcvT [Albimonas sp. CAU 1670]|uniref:glycine cleavage system aminomethyltransferase GcvT n=1 Tax=Albimonas sp. CAU 1670 TaxID=3032599 RepID=UPI0023DC5A10|nr:glycine cleavage system aminomethyltransferase GcvT [Albimonas sp. CAU 1670]MDF2234025.1 glycine cleavage system aminomethyltransferase GcvT [Albimonas sp. CAU 1670]